MNTMPDETSSDVLHLLAKHETMMAHLYQIFAESATETRELWQRLVLEEKAHAKVLAMLSEKLKAGGVHLNADRFNKAAIQTSIDFVSRKTDQAVSQGATDLYALSLALNIEESLIEKRYFSVFESESPEIQREFQAISDQTQEHRNEIRQRLDALKASSGTE